MNSPRGCRPQFPRVTDLKGEPTTRPCRSTAPRTVPETADFGRACLIARRLLERGVRFVQLFSGGTFGSPRRNWDGHEDMKANHGQEALRIDRPVAGLLRDLRRRGMLEDTLVLFTTEFGRTPFTQSAAEVVGKGRDHNPAGFTVWLAGAGLRHGLAHGSTDDIGWKAAENPVTWPDFHATVTEAPRDRSQASDVLSQRDSTASDQRPRTPHHAHPGLIGRILGATSSGSSAPVGLNLRTARGRAPLCVAATVLPSGLIDTDPA